MYNQWEMHQVTSLKYTELKMYSKMLQPTNRGNWKFKKPYKIRLISLTPTLQNEVPHILGPSKGGHKINLVITVNSQNMPPFPHFTHYFEAKWVLELVSRTRPTRFFIMLQPMINSHTMTAMAFWEERQFQLTCTKENQQRLVDTKLRSIEVTCFVSNDTCTASSKNLGGKQTRL